MPDEIPRHGLLIKCIVTPFVMLLLYVGSLGPVVWLMQREWLQLSDEKFKSIYAPVIWVYFHNEPFHFVLNWYYDLFTRR